MNMQQIADILEFDLEDVEMLVDLFLNDAKSSLENVNNAIERDDFEQIKHIAHGIKGSASNLMLDDIVEIALQIEQLSKSESDADYRSLFKKLKTQLNTIEDMKVTT